MSATYDGDHSDDEPTRRERRTLYEKVLGIVKYNTGSGTSPLIRPGQVVLIASHADHDSDRTRTAIRAAVENGDLKRIRGRLTRTDADAAQDVLDAEIAREDTDKRVVGWCNRQIKEGR